MTSLRGGKCGKSKLKDEGTKLPSHLESTMLIKTNSANGDSLVARTCAFQVRSLSSGSRLKGRRRQRTRSAPPAVERDSTFWLGLVQTAIGPDKPSWGKVRHKQTVLVIMGCRLGDMLQRGWYRWNPGSGLQSSPRTLTPRGWKEVARTSVFEGPRRFLRVVRQATDRKAGGPRYPNLAFLFVF
jgi:hypothetical protein